MSEMKDKVKLAKSKINYIIENSYFDVQGIGVSDITENHIAKLITKVAVGSVTVVWSILELRNLIKFKNFPSKG